MNLRKLIVVPLFIGMLLFGLWLPARASPAAQQQFFTATPRPDGQIMYIVQANDNCIQVATLHQISVDQLRALNPGLDENCILQIEQELLIGLGGPAAASPTPGPSPTPAPPTVTPTPFSGTTLVCVLLFEDANGDALRQESEAPIIGGAVSLSDLNGTYSETLTTAVNPDPEAFQGVCFEDVPEGDYNISVAMPDTYNPTMDLSYFLSVKAGDQAFVDFGAQSRAGAATAPEEPRAGGQSALLGILGGILLLGGLGLGWYALRLGRPQRKLSATGLLKKK